MKNSPDKIDSDNKSICLIEQLNEFRIVRDISDGAKHAKVTRNPKKRLVDSATVDFGSTMHEWDTLSAVRTLDQGQAKKHTVETSNGDYDVVEVAEKLVAEYEKNWFKNHERKSYE